MFFKLIALTSYSLSVLAAQSFTEQEPMKVDKNETWQNLYDIGVCVKLILLNNEESHIGSCDCMRNITNLSIPCNRYTLVMDLSQCLQRKLHDITSSDEVINATKLERIQNITESLTLLYRMAKLYDSVEINEATCHENYTDCSTSNHNATMYARNKVVTDGVLIKAGLIVSYTPSQNNPRSFNFCKKLLDEISPTERHNKRLSKSS